MSFPAGYDARAPLASTMSTQPHTTCPGCALRLPADPDAVNRGSFNASGECLKLFSFVVGEEFGDAVLFSQAHQLTADTYAVQHAGADHPDKSVGVHLCGLHLVHVRHIKPPDVPRMIQRMAERVERWPHFERPEGLDAMTVADIDAAESVEEHIKRVRAWSERIWDAWSPQHKVIAHLVETHLRWE